MNVHGLADFDSNNRINRPERPPQREPPPPRQDDDGNGMERVMQGAINMDQLILADQHKVLFVSGRRSLKNPREQTYWDMLVFGLCPQFSFCSLTFLLVLADLGVFIFQMTQGIAKESKNLLEVQSTTLMDHSNYYPPLRNSVELWRLLSAIFMHVNLLHFLGNILSTFFLVSRIEYTFGFPKALAIYLLSGIAGNIFSDAINKGAFLSAGASTALYGMIGVIIGYIILNWNGVDLLGPVIKCQLYCSAMSMLFFVLIFTPSSVNSNIDWYGHLGGFLGGLWLTAIHQTIISNTFQKVARIVFIVLFVIQFTVCFAVVYTSAKIPWM